MNHKYVTRDAEGRRVMLLVDDAVWAALHEPEPGWIQGRKGNGVSVLSFGAAAIDVERPAPQGTDAIMSERPLGLGREPHWTQAAADMRRTGDRATSALTLVGTYDRDAVEGFTLAHMPAHAAAETRHALNVARSAWWQHRAGVEASRALWRMHRAEEVAKRAHGEAAVAARKAGRRAQAFARQREALDATRANMTAANIASGMLTND